MPKHLLFHPKVSETTCYRAMKKTGSYRHSLTACKKTRFVVSQAWNSCPLKPNGHTNFKFFVFFLIFNKNFNFFASICWNFCNDFNSKFSFLPYIVPFLRTRLKPGRVSERFHWNWSEFQWNRPLFTETEHKKRHFFLCLFGIKLAKRPVSSSYSKKHVKPPFLVRVSLKP